MSEFIKPEHVVVRPREYLEAIIEHGMEKDLHDGEEVCEKCHGTGIVLVDNRYGLKEEPGRKAGMFPYMHQSVSFCPHCYNGIVHRCKFCGKVLPKGKLKCDCEQQRKIDRDNLMKKKKEAFDKAPILPEEKYGDYEYFYSEDYRWGDGYFRDFDEFFDYWAELEYEEGKEIERPEYAWVTEEVKIHVDAYDIVERATEDLYEDAIHDISLADIDKLQKYIDNWCENCGVGNTYCESHAYKARIPWEEYNYE